MAKHGGKEISADWDERAMSAAIDAMKDVVKESINARASIGSLGEVEWGWIGMAAVFEWSKTKSLQAVAEGGFFDVPRASYGREPAAWEAGAVEAILPALGDLELPWDKSIGEWSRDNISFFAWRIYVLMSAAIASRDEGANTLPPVARQQIEREMSAKAGGPLLSRGELNDDIPFAPEFR